MTALSLPMLWDDLCLEPHRDFMVCPTGHLAHGDLVELVRRICAAFDARGLSPGDRVMILVPDEIVSVAVFIACLADGLIPVLLTPNTPPERAAAVAKTVEPRGVLVEAARLGESWLATVPRPLILSSATQHLNRRWIWPSRKTVADRLAEGLALPSATRQPRLPVNPEGLAYLLFTSGTTQSPSGVMITRRNLMANLATIARVLEIDRDSRVFNDMVLAHADGMIQGPLMSLATGCCTVRAGGFSLQRLEDWLNEVRRARATHCITVPTVWSMIDRYALHDDYFDAPEFRHLVSVAAAMPPELWQRLESRFKRPLTNQYGLTETVASALYAGPHPEAGAFGTVGRPIDCEARVAPIEGRSDGIGELQLRGDNIFPGYWLNSARTTEIFTADRWMRTGDLARARQDGSYEILGRLKTVIMSGGFLIRPEEVDEVMLTHPAVVQSVTVGIPDDTFGEVPMTGVVLDGEADEATLTAHSRSKLETLKVPKRIVALSSIPRGDAGKPRFDAVRIAILAAVGTSGVTSGTGNAADLTQQVMQVASEVFRVPIEDLSVRTTPESVKGWDSFTQVSLIFALEDRFGIRIAASRAAAIRSLGEAVGVVKDQLGCLL